ncbi:hypothetical protein M0813_04752 [Anaeramoeba flamelloides]|uniref:SP-RING-type domain-containing protein n=1 Tax=Anaeramoeba flamelloides TaxID=1746091 RepID=A0ABQ8XIV4_9EUKA|nr:hypothetical protein M0813_04752 [Anaeramoeba flamelloides]
MDQNFRNRLIDSNKEYVKSTIPKALVEIKTYSQNLARESDEKGVNKSLASYKKLSNLPWILKAQNKLFASIPEDPLGFENEEDNEEIENEITTVSNYMKKLRSDYKELLKNNPKQGMIQRKTEKFEKELFSILHPDELSFVGEEVSERTLKCPLTMKVFKQPMRSKKCGHTYEKSAIIKYLSNSTKGCPVSACSFQVSTKDLERNIEMERQVRLAMMKKNSQAAQFEQIEEFGIDQDIDIEGISDTDNDDDEDDDEVEDEDEDEDESDEGEDESDDDDNSDSEEIIEESDETSEENDDIDSD